MFDIEPSEILIVALVAIVLIGPKGLTPFPTRTVALIQLSCVRP